MLAARNHLVVSSKHNTTPRPTTDRPWW